MIFIFGHVSFGWCLVQQDVIFWMQFVMGLPTIATNTTRGHSKACTTAL